ncbi:unnamed protein product [Urochloa humidicola]
MPREDRAHWSEQSIRCFLELLRIEKEKYNWSERSPTSVGWDNIVRAFNEQTRLGLKKRQLQNKWSDLKNSYFDWRDGLKHSGLGIDPITGEVTYDPVWAAAWNGEGTSEPVGSKYKRPPCCMEIYNILGHTPRDRGKLVSAGGHGKQQTSGGGSEETPNDDSQEDPVPGSTEQGSKRRIGQASVCSPRKKSSQTPSIDDCIESISEYMKDGRSRMSRQIIADEMARVHNILKEDGYTESDPFFVQALFVCGTTAQRRAFLDMTTKEGRASYVNLIWSERKK